MKKKIENQQIPSGETDEKVILPPTAENEGLPEAENLPGETPEENREDAAGELTKLKRELEFKSNVQAEIKLLKDLFPKLDIDEIPDEIWEACENGKGIAAQYALYFIKKLKHEAKAQNVNEKNSKSAPPRVVHDGGGEMFFTPEMVKRMSQNEVRKNYSAIMKSMEKWK